MVFGHRQHNAWTAKCNAFNPTCRPEQIRCTLPFYVQYQKRLTGNRGLFSRQTQKMVFYNKVSRHERIQSPSTQLQKVPIHIHSTSALPLLINQSMPSPISFWRFPVLLYLMYSLLFLFSFFLLWFNVLQTFHHGQRSTIISARPRPRHCQTQSHQKIQR